MAIGILPVRQVDAFIQSGGSGSTEVAGAFFRSVYVEPDATLIIDPDTALVLTIGGFLLTISPSGVEILV